MTNTLRDMKSLHSILTVLTFLVSVSVMTSCGKTSENNLDKEARDLFENSVRLIKSYSDSLKTARDTARIDELASRFDNRMTALNFKYPADTDLSLSEEENDSLIRLITGIAELKKKRLEELGRANLPSEDDLHLAVDTIEVKTK